jgi:hypothetical protein
VITGDFIACQYFQTSHIEWILLKKKKTERKMRKGAVCWYELCFLVRSYKTHQPCGLLKVSSGSHVDCLPPSCPWAGQAFGSSGKFGSESCSPHFPTCLSGQHLGACEEVPTARAPPGPSAEPLTQAYTHTRLRKEVRCRFQGEELTY